MAPLSGKNFNTQRNLENATKTTKLNLSLPANQLAIIIEFATRKDTSPEKMLAEWLSDRLAVEEKAEIEKKEKLEGQERFLVGFKAGMKKANKEKAKKNVRKNSRSANKRKARKG